MYIYIYIYIYISLYTYICVCKQFIIQRKFQTKIQPMTYWSNFWYVIKTIGRIYFLKSFLFCLRWGILFIIQWSSQTIVSCLNSLDVLALVSSSLFQMSIIICNHLGILNQIIYLVHKGRLFFSCFPILVNSS